MAKAFRFGDAVCLEGELALTSRQVGRLTPAAAVALIQQIARGLTRARLKG
ncbi:MAG: hypothetical protein U0165_16010 [Polyangiaceae bacterium]